MIKNFLPQCMLSLLLVVSFCRPSSGDELNYVDLNIMGIRLGWDFRPSLASKFGRGSSVEEGEAWCYKINKNTFIVFNFREDGNVAGVKIHNDPSYAYDCTAPFITANNVVTGRGVSLGMSSQEVLGKYGKPHVFKQEDGLVKMEYHAKAEQDPRIRIFFDSTLEFKQNKLVSIFLYNGP